MQGAPFAILDPAAGMSGDMLLGALLDLGASPEWLSRVPARLGLSGVAIAFGRAVRCGMACTQVTVRGPDGRGEAPGKPHAVLPHSHPAGESSQHHAGPHRHLPELLEVIARAPLSAAVRKRAEQAFRLLGEAEAAVHGVAPEEVALHEVGASDALVDIVAGIEGFEQLGIGRVYARAVAVGSGWVRSAHGVLPVPAPATARLLEGMEIAPDGPVTGEALTPTGAALLRVLSEGPPPAHWRLTRSGWGAGSRDPAHYPNALRVLIGQPAPEAGSVVTLSTDLDDLNPEYLEPLREALQQAGALDVQIWSTHMKKGRPGFRIEVLTDPAGADPVTEALFLHSTTTGIRRTVAERVTLPRRQIEVESGGFRVRVKVVDAPGGPRLKPEFEDVRVVARETGRPAQDVAREVESRARVMVLANAGHTEPDREERA
jgi:pyridinium-3,5-bisthiocarboxylic acid mononucleotide nickel chelatase